MDQKHNKQVLWLLFAGVLMGALDIAIVGPALPAIRSRFQVPENALSWVFGIYVLFNLIGTPLMSKLSDVFGRRSIYILDVTLFAIGSLVVSLADVAGGFSIVLLGRAIQGFGAGGIFPVASAVIGDTFPPEKRGSALGLIGAVFGIAFLIGPILGGVILAVGSWPWLFLINLPIAAAVILVGLKILPHTRSKETKRFDLAGMLALAGLLAAFAYGINGIDTGNFLDSLFSSRVWPFLATAVIFTFVLVLLEKRHPNPILPGSLFNRRQLTLAYILTAGAGWAEASLVFIPLLAVVALKVTSRSASFLLMPVVLAMAFGSPMVGRFLDKLGSKIVIMFGTLFTAIGMLLLSLYSSNMALFIIAGVFIGLGLSALLGAPIRYIMLNEARPEERSVAQGVVAVFTSMGQLVGAALVGAVAQSSGNYGIAFQTIGITAVLLVFVALGLKKRSEERINHSQYSGVEASQEAVK
jgi:EmrB/QacA subfamily drug resistance transporter